MFQPLKMGENFVFRCVLFFFHISRKIRYQKQSSEWVSDIILKPFQAWFEIWKIFKSSQCKKNGLEILQFSRFSSDQV